MTKNYKTKSFLTVNLGTELYKVVADVARREDRWLSQVMIHAFKEYVKATYPDLATESK